jgi:hypothetical protein
VLIFVTALSRPTVTASPTFHASVIATPMIHTVNDMFDVGAPVNVMVPVATAPPESAHVIRSTSAFGSFAKSA